MARERAYDGVGGRGRATPPRLIPAALLLMVLTLAVSAGARAQPTSTNDTVSYGDGKTLNFVDPEANRLERTVRLAGEPDALATGTRDGSVYALAKKNLYRFSASGEQEFRRSLKDLPADPPTEEADDLEDPDHLILNPYDGTLWVAGERTLLRLDEGGNLLGRQSLPGPVRALSLSADETLWALAGKELLHFSGEGEVLSRRNLHGAVKHPEYLALDPLGGFAWVAGKRGLVRVGLTGGAGADRAVRTGEGAKVEDLVVNPLDGTPWVATKESGREILRAYDRNGAELRTIGLRSSGLGVFESLTYDVANRALWIGGKESLLRLSDAGEVVARLPVKKEVEAVGVAPFRILPRATLISPRDGLLTNNPKTPVRLRLGATCNSSPCPEGLGYVSRFKVEATLNSRQVGGLFTIEGNEAVYVPETELPEGENTLVAEVVDPFGHRSQQTTSRFTVDTIPPKFLDVRPVDGAAVSEPEITISGKVDDPEAGIAFKRLRELGGAAVSEDPGGFSYKLPLQEGENAFRIKATDRATNESVHSFKVVYEIPIELEVTSPEQGSTVREAKISIEGVARGPRDLKVRVGEVEAVVKDGAFTAEGVELKRGENEIVVVATAPDGREEKRILKVTHRPSDEPPDTDPPLDSDDPTVRKERPPDSPLPAPGPLPPDPEEVAPPVDTSVATDTAASTRFLYEGDNPVQTGVEPGAIEERRVAVLKGRVLNRAGDPVPGVRITVDDHPEYGQTLTRDDGQFDLAVNGGGTITLDYEKDRFMPAQRQVETPWRDYATVEDVVLVGFSTRVTEVDLAGTGEMLAARGSAVTDEAGTRQSTVLFPADATAEMVLPDGTKKPLPGLDFRATEYTVGADGPESMPAPLPPTSGYTYAVEFSADEAVEAGAEEVRFSEPVYNYVENFLGFPVGTDVPTGYYDREKSAWIPSDDGRIIKILAIEDGKAGLDVDGSGNPADAAALQKLGVTDEERGKLATLYEQGQSLWRVPISHFTPWDHNWPYGPPEGAAGPAQAPPLDPGPLAEPECESGSIIECQNQILGENIGVSGTPFSLHYGSDRVRGRTAANTLDIPLTGDTPPPNLKRLELEASVAGQSIEKTFPAGPNQKHTLTWDGDDAYGRDLIGEQDVKYRIGYVYDLVYQQPADFQRSFGALSGVPFTANRWGREVTLWQEGQSTVATWDERGRGLGGLSLDVLHQYDPEGRALQMGDGSRRRAEDVGNTITTVAGTGRAGYSGDGGPATTALINKPYEIATGPSGDLYISDIENNRVRRVEQDGTITTVAGNGSAGFGGDGGPATQARLYRPRAIAVDSNGNLYIADGANNRIRKVNHNGTITTVAGTNTAGFSGDGGLATEAQLNYPNGIAVESDGSLYIADRHNHRVRKVSPGGIITTVAGNGTAGFSGDGGLASKAQFNQPHSVDLGLNGSIYVADLANGAIRRIGTDGIIRTVVGTGQYGYSGDGSSATKARLKWPAVVEIGPDGTLYIADHYDQRIRRVDLEGTITTLIGTGYAGSNGDGRPASGAQLNYPGGLALSPSGGLYIGNREGSNVRLVAPPLPGTSTGDITIPSKDGAELYVFDSRGRHLRTLDSVTGKALYTFSYDGEGRIAGIEDIDGLKTRIERDAAGNATAIVAPNGERTDLSLGAEGYLAGVSNPAGESVKLTYGEGGLLASLADPKGNTTRFSYDNRGRLADDRDPEGGFKALSRTDDERGFTATLPTAMGREKTFKVENLPNGDQRRVNTDPSGLTTEKLRRADGTNKTVAPDGTTVETVEGPDPRFGMQSPLLKSATVKTPGGLTSTATTDSKVTLKEPNNPLSVTSITDTSTVNGRTWTSAYDASTKKVTSASPEGRKSFATVDDKGRVILEESPGFTPTNYTYDERGRMAQAVTGTGTESRTVSYAYDEKDRVKSVTDPAGRTTGYAYDAAGRVTKQTLPDGRVISYAYDANGNLTSLTPPEKPEHAFTYTARNEEKSYTPPDVGEERTNTYEYNLDRQPTSVTRPGGERVEVLYDSGGRASKVVSPEGETLYAYDEKTGNLTSVTAPGGEKLTYTHDGSLPLSETLTGEVSGKVSRKYDNSFRVTELTVNGESPTAYAYDKDDLLTKAGALTISRDPANALVTGTALGGTTDKRSYDTFGQSAGYTALSGATEQYKTTYERDSLGRITEKTETIAGETTTHTYRYDQAGRLVEVKKNGRVAASYTYDPNGNRLSKQADGQRTEGRYDAQDRLTTYGDNEYRYTADGDLKSKTNTKSGESTSYDYDAFGNLKAVILPGGKKVEYVTDGQDRRVGKKVDSVLKQGFLYSGQLAPVAELDGSGNVVSRFVYGTKANVPDYMVRGGTTYRIISDHLGSPRLVVNASTGEVVQRIDYDEFGNVLKDTNPGFQPFGFVGGLYDQETGLTRFGARDYDAEAGRWTSKDSIGFAGGDTNLYGYVVNDPVNLIDPEGLLSGDEYGQDAMEYWAEKSIQPDNAWYENAGYWSGGLLSSLWTPCTSTDTAFTLGTAGTGSLAYRGYKWGGEIVIGRNWRIAPFGNRTGHPTGRYPHYHHRKVGPDKNTIPGQGIGRHRPWDTKSTDRMWRDRF